MCSSDLDILSVLVTYPSLPAKPVKDLIAPGRAHPGAINFSSGRRGTVGHVAGASSGAMATTRYTLVAHKGLHQALMDVMAGHVQFQFAIIPNLLPHVHSGKLNMLAQTGDSRSPSALQYPTIQESGLPGFVLRSPFSFLAPANLDRKSTRLNSSH